MAGYGRPNNGVAALAYVPAAAKRRDAPEADVI